MENIVQRCEAFAKNIDCELNNTAKECEEGKTFMIKYCSNKECTGISSPSSILIWVYFDVVLYA